MGTPIGVIMPAISGGVERRVLSAVEFCRTAALGGHVEACGDCGVVRIAYNTCRNALSDVPGRRA